MPDTQKLTREQVEQGRKLLYEYHIAHREWFERSGSGQRLGAAETALECWLRNHAPLLLAAAESQLENEPCTKT